MTRPRHLRRRTLRAHAAAAAALSLTLALLGCAAEPKAAPPSNAAETDPGPADVATATATERRLTLLDHAIQNSDVDLNAPTPATAGRAPSPALGVTAQPPRTNLTPALSVEPGEPDLGATRLIADRPPPALPDVPGGEPTAENRDPAATRAAAIERHAHELAGLLRLRSNASGDLLAGRAMVAALDAILPGTFNSHFIGFDARASSGGVDTLTDAERTFLVRWRDMHTAVHERLRSEDFDGVVDAVIEHAEELKAIQPLTVADARLCTRVEGFGVYNELDTFDGGYKLLAGRRHKLIVYVELDRFSSERATQEGVAGYAVDLTQSLALFHMGRERDLLAWRLDDQRIEYFSRRPRRDFFVVQIIELPETLTIDRYALKVTVRDAARDQLAERTILIDLVGDASAFSPAD